MQIFIFSHLYHASMDRTPEKGQGECQPQACSTRSSSFKMSYVLWQFLSRIEAYMIKTSSFQTAPGTQLINKSFINHGSTQVKDNRVSCPEAEEGTKHKTLHPKQEPALNDWLHNFKNTSSLKKNIKYIKYKILLKILPGKK